MGRFSKNGGEEIFIFLYRNEYKNYRKMRIKGNDFRNHTDSLMNAVKITKLGRVMTEKLNQKLCALAEFSKKGGFERKFHSRTIDFPVADS